MNWIKWVMNKNMRMNKKYECGLIKIKYTLTYLKTVLYGEITLVLQNTKGRASKNFKITNLLM